MFEGSFCFCYNAVFVTIGMGLGSRGFVGIHKFVWVLDRACMRFLSINLNPTTIRIRIRAFDGLF